MRFTTDEIKPFYEVRQNLSKAIDEVERDGGEIVIAKHGKPVAALLSAAGLYRYREVDRLMDSLLTLCEQSGLRQDSTGSPNDLRVNEILRSMKMLRNSV